MRCSCITCSGEEEASVFAAICAVVFDFDIVKAFADRARTFISRQNTFSRSGDFFLPTA